MDIEGRVAIVTGGSGGIGREICIVLASRGASIAVADLIPEGLGKVRDELATKGYKSLPCLVDVTKKSLVEKMVEDVLAHFGQIDILVNCAGVIGAPGFETSPISREEDWDITYEVNVKGVVLPSIAVAEHMKTRRYGKLVNISSAAGRIGRPQHPHYSASKAAVINWTQAHAMQLGPWNINVNAVCPTIVWTPMMEKVVARKVFQDPSLKGLSPQQIFEKTKSVGVLGRDATAEDIAKAVAFFVSEDAKNITGQSLNVDGGIQMN